MKTKEIVSKIALLYTSRGQFRKIDNSNYQWAASHGVLDEICQHMAEPKTRSYTVSELAKLAALYTSKAEFRQNSGGAYDAAYRKGILDEICNHMATHSRLGTKWSFEKLQEEALRYENKIEFRSKHPKAYDAAYKKGILDEICNHMAFKTYWSKEKLELEALKYNARIEFQKNNHAAYQAAQRFKLLDDICSHMKLSANISEQEQNLFDIIKQKFPKAQKLRDRKVQIANKPHIEGFDIDIYIPELRKGIEFDGTYWHSVEGLKRSRDHWPEEDLRGYAALKDDHFKSRGIDLLHIKEEEWMSNKKNCIEKCFAFLGEKNV